MKHRARIIYTALCLSLYLTAAAAPQVWHRTPHGMDVTTPHGIVSVEYFTPSTVRIVKHPADSAFDKESYAVTATPSQTQLKVKTEGGTVSLTSKELTVAVDIADAKVSFKRPDGTVIVAEAGAPEFSPFDDGGKPSMTVAQTFTLSDDEDIYGLGNLENGQLSQRGISATLMPGNIDDGIPVFVSTKGYGIYWDNYAPTQFSDNAAGTRFESSPGQGVDYYFMAGKTLDDVVAGMRDLTGQVPMFPLWTYGFWQSRERYKSADELLAVVDGYRKNNIPLDGIIQDWQYWGNNYLWNAMEFMNEEFAAAPAMIDSVHRSNAHIIISIWSSFGPKTKQYAELDSLGLLFNFSTWPQSGISHIWPPRMDYPSGVRVYDAYSPVARDIYWKHLRRLKDLGIDGWWMDSTEPDHYDVTEEDMNTPTHLGTFRSVRGAYPLMTVGGVADHQMADFPNQRVFILTRSGWAGQQRYGCNVWTGDVTSSWDALRRQVPAGLNFSLTGNPNFNSDLGGFFAGRYNRPGLPAVKNPAFHELYVRWMQFGALCPMMRSHGTDVPREIYLYGAEGEPVYDAMVAAVKLRYSLLPYIYSTAWQVSDKASTFMRPLAMDFPGDKEVRKITDQYMFGNSLLVAPVLNPQYTPEEPQDLTPESAAAIDFTRPRSTQVYLPTGTTWWDFYDGTRMNGGKLIDITTRFDRIPLYVKAGSILPIGPDVQWAEQKPWDALEVRIYPGADGSFTLYEDEFDNNNYRSGAYSLIPFKWSDRSRTLTIEPRTGSYEGMPLNRTFTFILPDGTRRTLSYTGNRIAVKM